ncbi:DUF3800 domain-containing protein [Fusobacterium varium]|uniref:DUF3800 domain-containing protein n=1 Tax=Fusobacterium varium TaxID=856 RepID=UPI001F316945|nr:DUF3800 domain-containing protein [Fusobacterium varium]MCF2673618.1 DUF3800 domain-containing protein [Fusobacterium varium]
MVNIYIDESGSMTTKYSKDFPFFIVSIVWVKDKEKLKKILKRFIGKNIEKLKKLDTENKMFKNGEFEELKGSSLNKEMKIKLIEYLCKNNLFEVFYIKIVNSEVQEKLYENTARAFNYILGRALHYYLKKNKLPFDNYLLQIDTRNVRSQAINSLEDYLNIELAIEEKFTKEIKVSYQNSECNTCIQVADVFANFYYSQSLTNSYTEIFEKLKESGYINDDFIFPLSGKKSKKYKKKVDVVIQKC